MEGGAWQSDVFDNGRDFQKTRAPPAQAGAPMEAGMTPPAMYNPSPVPMGKDSRTFGIIAVTLRSALIVFSLIALCVMATNKQTFLSAYDGVYSTSFYEATVKFTAVKAFVGLLSVDIIVCVYAIVQLVLCFVQASTKGTFISSPTTSGSMLTFICDTMLAYALIAAAGAAADAAALLHTSGYCDSVDEFCSKGAASVAVSFLAFAFLAMSAALYPIRLLRMSKCTMTGRS